MKKPTTGHDKIKRWLNKGFGITPLTAWKMFSVYRLSSVIHRLRREGMNIKTIIHCAGKEYSYAEYRLVKP
jgi:hypothetical protein